MKPPTPSDINRTLRQIESTERDDSHPRRLAQQAIARYRQGSAIDHSYDFSCAPVGLRQTVYNQTVRYHCSHSWWRRLTGRWVR